jgi:signal transduction histidine kinase
MTSIRNLIPITILIGGDALQMRRLLQNLLGNALKYRRKDDLPLLRLS